MNYPEKVEKAEREWHASHQQSVITLADLDTLCVPEPTHGDTWGNVWRLNTENLTLELLNPSYGYYVDLERITSHHEIIGTIGHLMTKIWCTGKVIGHFVEALWDIAGIEAGEWYSEFSIAQIVRKKWSRGEQVRSHETTQIRKPRRHYPCPLCGRRTLRVPDRVCSKCMRHRWEMHLDSGFCSVDRDLADPSTWCRHEAQFEFHVTNNGWDEETIHHYDAVLNQSHRACPIHRGEMLSEIMGLYAWAHSEGTRIVITKIARGR